MVHARSFSFTDESTSVDFPSWTSTISGVTLTGQHSLEPAGLLFQLRSIQSKWYQELFQSSRVPLQSSSPYIWQACQDMRDWSETFPDTLPLAFKEFFDLELLYSYVYCLAPSCRVQVVSQYGKTLIFEYSMAYMQKIFPISKDPINTVFYTYHDALRVYFVGSQFLAVLMDNPDQLLSGVLPYDPAVLGSLAPPPLPITTGIDSIDRSINCVTHIKETLKTFGQRWDDSQALLSSFEAQSESILQDLHQRRRRLNEMTRPGHNPPNFPPQSSFENIRTLSAEDWAKSGRSFANNGVPDGHGRGGGSGL
jgi:hypothetical protein